MKCETVQKQLEAYIEGELSESKQKAMEAHISACESCRKELALARSIPRLVGSLMTPPTPEEIIPDTLEQLHETSNGRWEWLGRWQFAAVACLLVAVALLGIGHQRMNREPQITDAELAAAQEDLNVMLGIMSEATQQVQLVAMTEGAMILNITKDKSDDAMQTILDTQLEASGKLWRNLIDLAQLNL